MTCNSYAYKIVKGMVRASLHIVKVSFVANVALPIDMQATLFFGAGRVVVIYDRIIGVGDCL